MNSYLGAQHIQILLDMQTLLDRKDRMSMYSGFEVRVPFCDYRIAEYLYTVPWEMKDYQNQEKGLLREAVRGLLPEEVLWRKKSPYPKTHHPAYLKAVSEKLREIIANPNSPLLCIVRREALETLLQSNNAVPWYGQLMTTPQTIAYFLQINYWLQKYQIRIMPELSFGSHFFQDIVESDIFYAAIFEGDSGVTFCPECILDRENLLGELLPGETEWNCVVHLARTAGLTLYSDITSQNLMCFG